MLKNIFIVLLFWNIALHAYDENQMHFVTVSDTECYPMLLECISGIVQTNGEDIGQIAVFDLGLTAEQRETLNQLPHVHVYDIEPVNPSMFKKFVIRKDGRLARGWYSWKPVVIKQALDMFPTILYLDASTEVRKSLRIFFQHIRENHYLFINSICNLRLMLTKRIFNKIKLDRPETYLDVGMDAGFQGLTRAMYFFYVLPVYDLAKDIKNFKDDGSSPGGFGRARHDQALFSLYARFLNLDIKVRPNFDLFINKQRISIQFEDYIGLKNLKSKSEHNRFQKSEVANLE